MEERAIQRIFILGSGGRLGAALMKEWQKLDCLKLVSLSRSELDFSQPEAAVNVLKNYKLTEKDFIINCAAMTNVDQCEEDSGLAMNVNATTPGLLAQLAADAGARFLHVSTDYVFDGKLERAYRETDQPHPISHYGASKLAGEEAVMATSPHHYVARVSWVFGPERPSFVDQIIERAFTSDQSAAIDDKTSSPAYTKDLAEWFQIFLQPEIDGGIYHLCNSGLCSWREYGEYALQVAARYGMPLRTTSVAPLKLSEMKNFIAQRPQHSALDTTKFSTLLGKPLRSWQEAVEEYIRLQVTGNRLQD
ncbi:MAG: dTDP-4-dehydrorhamnose reductase [Chthoniobacterales bacterium]|nr:dTDP-4-dehydrorhamnose reductase [Chthoniobacterales bacterium]